MPSISFAILSTIFSHPLAVILICYLIICTPPLLQSTLPHLIARHDKCEMICQGAQVDGSRSSPFATLFMMSCYGRAKSCLSLCVCVCEDWGTRADCNTLGNLLRAADYSYRYGYPEEAVRKKEKGGRGRGSGTCVYSPSFTHSARAIEGGCSGASGLCFIW